MKAFISCLLFCLAWFTACSKSDSTYRQISPGDLKDKIAGGWAGKMIGVTYGGPTEFRAQGTTFEDTIFWKPADIANSVWQDDLYVQLTFLMTMDQYGEGAPAKKYQEMFAKAGYSLWHANVQARKNYFDSIFPPLSGEPAYNLHADDIDFQIESDYIGFMCPGLPQKAVQLCDKTGRIMNYGDGLYGGIFVAALYAEAFFSDSIRHIVAHALQSIPYESEYAEIIRDVIALHSHYPDDWREAWKELEAKWGFVDICGAGSTFNIDAKLNGAYIAMGLLYGDGDPYKTMEVSTRCGQDSDCNPSNAMAVLGVMKGLSNLPVEMQQGIEAVKDSVFIFTDYTFARAVENTYKYALSFIQEAGGTANDKVIRVKVQPPQAPAFEESFPNVVFDRKVSVFDKQAWQTKGKWNVYRHAWWGQAKPADQAMYADQPGDEISFRFTGTGAVIMGNWVKDGGKADVYLDGKLHRSIDTYFYYGDQEHHGINLWHAFGLQPGEHTIRLVVKGERRPESLGNKVYITEYQVFKTEPKHNENYIFTFLK